jgi:deoxyribodipyrimidine photo-lyase
MPSAIAIFIFHRDFRLEDHPPLQRALDLGEVLPLFVFTPEQVGNKAPVKSEKSIECMITGLNELDEMLNKKYKSRLCVMYDDTIEALSKIYSKIKFTAIIETKDYTPYAKKREKRITEFCDKHRIQFEAIDDIYLLPPGTIRNGSGKTYQKFTPFYDQLIKSYSSKIDKPFGFVKGSFVKGSLCQKLSTIKLSAVETTETDRIHKGGREEGLMLLSNLPKKYNETRNIISIDTSGLSVHHHFGTISIRETYYVAKKMGGMDEFIRQLVFRDFYGNIMAYFEDLYGEDALKFQSKWSKLTPKQEADFEAWKTGTTGVDIIDAAMTQLNEGGWVHNKARTLVANYAVKTLKLPWRLCEQYYASKLLDYDFTQNMFGWMNYINMPFSEPPYRVYNPDSFAKKFDPDKEYVQEWLEN